MNTRLILPLIITGLLLSGCTTPASNGVTAADITVEFSKPDDFRDARSSFGGSTDQAALATLRTCLQENAAPRLQPGQKLRVTFTDLDLAGEFEPQTGAESDHIRIIKGIYIPRQVLTFELTDDAGKVLRQGTRTLTDLNFQSAALRVGSEQPYYYDKVLLQNWLSAEFK